MILSSRPANVALSAFWIAAWIVTGTAPAQADEPTRVFLFAGQSNMVGADARTEQIDDYPEFQGAGAPQPEVLYSYVLGDGSEASQGWGPLKPLRSFGPEITFARRVRRHAPFPIAIIKSAVGGTTVAFDWNPDAPEQGQKLYPRTLQRIRDSLQELDRRGVRYRLEAVMWHQGENDMLDRKLYQQYAAGLTKLITRLRTDLQAPELKWYLAEVSEKGIWGMDHRHNLSVLRQQQEQVLNADRRLRWVPTSHLAFEVMGSGQPHYHYGTQGQLQLGEAFAAEYLRDAGLAPAVTERRLEPPSGGSRPRKVRLFVLAGQRNMEGEDAYVAELARQPRSAALLQDRQDVWFRYSLGGGVRKSTGWEPLGVVDDLRNFGPELSLGARLRQALPADEGLAIVKFTHSGAQGPDWFPDGSAESHRNLYPKFVRFVGKAQADLERQGYEVRLAGVFWHLGENDTYFGPYAQNSAKWLKQLIDHSRRDWKQPELDWYVSEQHPRSPWKNVDLVNSKLRDLARDDAHLTVVPTAPLPHARRHFGTEGTVQLGEALAEAYLKRE